MGVEFQLGSGMDSRLQALRSLTGAALLETSPLLDRISEVDEEVEFCDINLTTSCAWFDKLALCPRLRTLRLLRCQLHDDTFCTLLPICLQLQELDLTGSRLSRDCFELMKLTFVTHNMAPSKLVFANCDLGAQGPFLLGGMLSSPLGIQHLDLSNCNIDDDRLLSLAEGLRAGGAVPALRELVLRRNSISNPSVVFQTLQTLPNLVATSLQDNVLDSTQMSELCTSIASVIK